LKIGRAEEHAKAVSDEITSWDEADSYRLALDKDAQGHCYRIIVQFNIPPAKDRWALVAGDCVHNLRSALDHLVYAIDLLPEI